MEFIVSFIGELIAISIGDFLLNFIGGTLRYLCGTVWGILFDKPLFTFKEYINGPKKSNFHDEFGHQFNNKIIAFLFLGIIIVILAV